MASRVDDLQCGNVERPSPCALPATHDARGDHADAVEPHLERHAAGAARLVIDADTCGERRADTAEGHADIRRCQHAQALRVGLAAERERAAGGAALRAQRER